MMIFQSFTPQRGTSRHLDYSDFVSEVKSGRVDRIQIEGAQIEVEMHDGSKLYTYSPNLTTAADWVASREQC